MNRIRVIIADDHAVMRDGLKALLASAPDIEVVAEADNGYQALRRALELTPDVVIADIAMPEMNGIDAARQIVARLPATRVLMLSMHSDAEYVHRALAAGASGFVLKEAAGAEVASAVRALHGGRGYFSAAIAELAREFGAAGARAHASGPIDSLSRRERQVLQLVVEGRSSVEIAAIVSLSPKTVETYRSRIMKKLAVGDVASLVKFCIQHGLTDLG